MGRRAAALCVHALARFSAQVLQGCGRFGAVRRVGFGQIAQAAQGPYARRQQVADRQLGQLERGIVASQTFCLRQRFAAAPLGNELVDRQQALFGLAIAQGGTGLLCRRCRMGRRRAARLAALGLGGGGRLQAKGDGRQAKPTGRSPATLCGQWQKHRQR